MLLAAGRARLQPLIFIAWNWKQTLVILGVLPLASLRLILTRFRNGNGVAEIIGVKAPTLEYLENTTDAVACTVGVGLQLRAAVPFDIHCPSKQTGKPKYPVLWSVTTGFKSAVLVNVVLGGAAWQ